MKFPQSIAVGTEVNLESLREFVSAKVIAAAATHDKDDGFPLEIYRELHRLGWLQAFIPREFGGGGLPTSDLIHIAREVAYGSSGVYTSACVLPLALTPIIHFAQPRLRATLCEDFVRNFQLWSFCFTEPDAGFDINSLKTTASKVPGGYLLNGVKCFITNAGVADHLTVIARNPNAERTISAFYVPANSPGVTRGKPLEKMGQRCSNTSELFFEKVFIPDEHLIGVEGQGFKIAYHTLQRNKTLVSAAAVGVSLRAMDLITEHLAHRIRYEKPLLAQPMIQGLLAQLQTEIEASWLLTCRSAATWDAGVSAVKEASMAKLFATHTAVKVVSEIVELFGGYGYCREFEIERLHRDVRVLEIYEGSSFIQQTLIARELFGKHLTPAATTKRRAA